MMGVAVPFGCITVGHSLGVRPLRYRFYCLSMGWGCCALDVDKMGCWRLSWLVKLLIWTPLGQFQPVLLP